jgi:hypothetical protein
MELLRLDDVSIEEATHSSMVKEEHLSLIVSLFLAVLAYRCA